MMNAYVSSFGRFGSSSGRRYASTPMNAPPRTRKPQQSFRGTGVKSTGGSSNGKQVTTDVNKKSDECSVCHIIFTSGSHKRDHMKGKKHAKMLQKINGTFGRCLLCNMQYESARDCVSHLFSQTHIRNQMELDRTKGNKTTVQPHTTVKSTTVKSATAESPTIVAPKRKTAPIVVLPKQKSLPVIRKRERPTDIEEDDDDMMCIYTRASGRSGLGEDETRLTASDAAHKEVVPKPRNSKQKRNLPLKKKTKKSP